MFEMLRNMSPPVGFGTKCPSKLAYKVCRFSYICEGNNIAFRNSTDYYKNLLDEIKLVYIRRLIDTAICNFVEYGYLWSGTISKRTIFSVYMS